MSVYECACAAVLVLFVPFSSARPSFLIVSCLHLCLHLYQFTMVLLSLELNDFCLSEKEKKETKRQRYMCLIVCMQQFPPQFVHQHVCFLYLIRKIKQYDVDNEIIVIIFNLPPLRLPSFGAVLQSDGAPRSPLHSWSSNGGFKPSRLDNKQNYNKPLTSTQVDQVSHFSKQFKL